MSPPQDMDTILVLNAGSSSVKFATFRQGAAPDEMSLLSQGHVASSEGGIELLVKGAAGELLERSHRAADAAGFDADRAIDRLFDWIGERSGGMRITAVGHRVVHGGADHVAPVKVTDAVLAELDLLVPLAPLHQPHNLKAIRVAAARWPGAAQVACFDTAFHASQSPVAKAFALPRSITEAGVRRYGFHGLSYEYIATQLPRVLGTATARGKVIAAHLGNGASLCGMVDGRSCASTMGFSALDGLMMGTRCGSLDAGVLLYLLQHLRMDSDQIADLLYSRSGLLGVSGLSSDMQVLLASTDPRAAEAIDLFVHRIVCEIGSMAAAMGGIDAIVFTAGIGEHAAAIRARVCAGCAWLGAAFDAAANEKGDECIDSTGSALRIAVIPTDEELMIAMHTARVVDET